MTILTTTFNKLKLAGACGQEHGSEKGYNKLAQYLGGVTKYGKDTPISLAVVAESNGLADAMWCLRATVEDFEGVARPFVRGYLADMLEHFARQAFSSDAVAWLRTGVLHLRNKATTREELASYAATAAYAAAAAYAAYANAVTAGAYGAAYAAYATAAYAYATATAATAANAANAAANAANAANASEQQWQTEHFIELLRPSKTEDVN